jgi:hypothetical protein
MDSPTESLKPHRHAKTARQGLKHMPLSKKSLLAATALSIATLPVFATLQDEIQVYTDEINAPGEYGLELHINTTPKGITAQSYPGEITNHHGTRLTAEFTRGLTPTTELGLYLPTVYDGHGRYDAAGVKARFKWLPIQPEDNSGFFAGMNFEWSQVRQRYSDSPQSVEIRNILGWRGKDWLLSINPIFVWNTSPGFARTPALEVATKVSRKINDSLSLGWERYNDRGLYNQPLSAREQGVVNYLVADFEAAGLDFNVGVGKGSTPASDPWTVKAIIGYSFGK